LPHSIIVTAEGTEGEAPELPNPVSSDSEAVLENMADDAEPALPSLTTGKPPAVTTRKPRTTQPRSAPSTQSENTKQMTLGLEKSGKNTGKKNGGKKTKK
jgi:hypothetical protein